MRTADVAEVLELIETAERTDGFGALNEAALLRLRHQDPQTRHLVHRAGADVVGYGQLAPGAGSVAEAALVVRPDHRRHGVGSTLLDELLSEAAAGGRRLEIWAVRNTPAALALADRAGLEAIRELLIMRRALTDLPAASAPPPGVVLRGFHPGADEEVWLAVNGRAFADHPEQGSLTRTDLDERMAEPWFDPAGFWLAVRDGTVVGFHWTKRHPGRLGEVYVLGVDPAAGIRGLGRVLLDAGLRHLAAVGDTQVLLYVDAANERAVALYERAGFAVSSRDVQYAGPPVGGSALATMQSGRRSTDPAPPVDPVQESR